MEKLTKDTITLIALSLNLSDLSALCLTSSKFNKICNSKSFWYNKLISDFDIYPKDIFPIEEDPKTFYMLLMNEPDEVFYQALDIPSELILGIATEQMFRLTSEYDDLKEGETYYLLYSQIFNVENSFLVKDKLDSFINQAQHQITSLIFDDLDNFQGDFLSFYGFPETEINQAIRTEVSKIKTQDSVLIKIPTFEAGTKLYDIYVLRKFIKK